MLAYSVHGLIRRRGRSGLQRSRSQIILRGDYPRQLANRIGKGPVLVLQPGQPALERLKPVRWWRGRAGRCRRRILLGSFAGALPFVRHGILSITGGLKKENDW